MTSKKEWRLSWKKEKSKRSGTNNQANFISCCSPRKPCVIRQRKHAKDKARKGRDVRALQPMNNAVFGAFSKIDGARFPRGSNKIMKEDFP
jgi:hypothetical protein